MVVSVAGEVTETIFDMWICQESQSLLHYKPRKSNNKGHVLVVPNQHFENIFELLADYAGVIGDILSMTFFLVRHALKDKSVGDVPITHMGVLQAQWTARRFCDLPISVILSNPLRRAKETAEYIALETKSAIHEDNRLRERANRGDLTGQTFEEFVEMSYYLAVFINFVVFIKIYL
ncbi:MAG: histidine phosphatase family protein [Paenibacillus sp.]|nr:histidine phosphatase family protein [Paenibacillus sp.]